MLKYCFLSSFVEFCSVVSEEKSDMSQPIRSVATSCFSDWCWDLASCQVSLNSVQWFQWRNRKCLSQSEAGAAILVFRSARKNINLVLDVEILLPVNFRWIPFRGEVENISANQRPGRPSLLSDGPGKKNKNLVEGVEIFLPVKFRLIPFSGFRGEVEILKVNDGRTTDNAWSQ